MDKFDEIFQSIKADLLNAEFEKAGINPLYFAYPEVKSVCRPGVWADCSRKWAVLG